MRSRRGLLAVVLGAVLLILFLGYLGMDFLPRSQKPDSPPHTAAKTQSAGGRQVSNGARVESANVAADENATAKLAPQSPIVTEPTLDTPAIAATNVLRVVLQGISEENAPEVTVTLTSLREVGESGERDELPSEIFDSWPCQGLTSEFDLDPLLETVGSHHESVDEFLVAVDHPQRFLETIEVPLSSGRELESGQTVYEVQVRLVQPEFWPEFTLAVRDAHTRADLHDIELRIRPGIGAASWGKNQTSTLLGSGLSSPIALMGGREPDEPEVTVGGLALSPAAGESPRLVELERRCPPERGVIVSARAPGYAWSGTSLDVSQGERELLLQPAAELDIRLASAQIERYAGLNVTPILCVYWIRTDGGVQYVHFERLDETLEAEGLQIDSLAPGGYRVSVELGGGSWKKRPVLVQKDVDLAAGETRELALTLADPPAPPAPATLGGVVSIPDFGGEESVRLQLYFQPTQKWKTPHAEFSLDDLPRVDGTLPSWSFCMEDLPVGMYRLQLMPFLEVLMIELPAGGREDVEFVIPELSEVLVETVDERTGERVPLDEFYYKKREQLPGQLQNEWARADTVEPGRFRFWTTPGAMSIWPKNQARLGYGLAWMRLEIAPGLQSLRFELAPVYAMRFEFREAGVTLPTGPQGLQARRDIRAVGHEGRVTGDGLQKDMRVEVSAPGIYEINFEAVTDNRYDPIPPRRVDVRADETAEVIVELRRK